MIFGFSSEVLSLENNSDVQIPLKVANRAPANYIPDDDFSVAYYENEIWLSKVFVKDDAGVMDRMKNDFTAWEKQEEFERLWGVTPLDKFKTPTRQAKINYFNRNLLRYADKRLAGEVKKSEKGSTLNKVGQVQKTLRPSSQVQIAGKVKLKFKARLLQGKASVALENPYVENNIEFKADGSINMTVKKNISMLKLTAQAKYDVQKEHYFTEFSRPLNSKTVAKVSSHQNSKTAPFSNDSDKRVEVFFSHSF